MYRDSFESMFVHTVCKTSKEVSHQNFVSNSYVITDEFDSSMSISDRFNSVEGDVTDVKNDKHSILDENFTEGNYLFPPIFDVAPFAELSANATCGTMFLGADETFCKLSNPSSCSVCSGLHADKKHSISFAVDNDSSNWWQSPTFQSGPQYEYVTITVDLKQVCILLM